MSIFDQLTEQQKFFLCASAYFASQVLADNEPHAIKSLKVLEAATHLMTEDEFADMGQFISNYMGQGRSNEGDNNEPGV